MRVTGIIIGFVLGLGSVCLGFGALAQQSPTGPSLLPPSLQPMYGPGEKTEASKKADAAYVAKIESLGVTRVDAAKRTIGTAWTYFEHGDLDGAILRFNQAWLLDPENSEVYHGFAAVSAQRGVAPSEIESYYQTGLSKPSPTPAFYVDYARFLTLQKRFDDAIAMADTALKTTDKAANARAQISFAYFGKQDLPKACDWANQAKANGDLIDPPYIKTVCKN